MECNENYLLFQIYFNLSLLLKKDQILEPLLKSINEEIKLNEKTLTNLLSNYSKSDDLARIMICSTEVDCNQNFDTTKKEWIDAKNSYKMICRSCTDDEFYLICELSKIYFEPHYKNFILKDRYIF